jgi:hypothetical protein
MDDRALIACDFGVKAMRGLIALQKHFVQNLWRSFTPFRDALGVPHASSRRFDRSEAVMEVLVLLVH